MRVRRLVLATASLSAASLALAAPSALANPHRATSSTAGTSASATASASASASATVKSGGVTEEHFFLAVAGNHLSVVAHGAFAGGGRDVALSQSDVMHLGGGTLTIRHPDRESTFTDKVDPKTCFVAFAITGRYTLGRGTGKYAGVTGSGTYKVSEQGFLKRTKSGTCSQTAAPTIEVGFVRAHGPVTLP